MVDYVISIDAGTTGIRALAFELPSFEVLTIAYRELQNFFPASGWVEQNPLDIVKLTVECLRETSESLTKIGVTNGPTAIGITNQRETLVCWDAESDKILHNAIVWQDRRTEHICKKLKSQYGESLIREKTGLILDPYFSATKLMWLIENGIVKPNGNLRVGTPDTWLTYNLFTNLNEEIYITDIANASRTLWLNIRSGNYDPELLDIFNVKNILLPQVVDSAGQFGELTHPDLKGTLLYGSPLCGIVGDQQSALFGQGCYEPNETKVTLGTGTFILTLAGTTCPVPRSGILSTVAWKLPDEPINYALEGSIFVSGALISWLIDTLEIIDSPKEIDDCISKAANLMSLQIAPSLTGLGSPYWNPRARGMISGISAETGKNELVKAAVESIAFQTNDVVKVMNDVLNKKISQIKVDGGVSRNSYLLNCIASLCDANVLRPKNLETTAVGAAKLATIGIGEMGLEELKDLYATDINVTPTPSFLDESRIRSWNESMARINKYFSPPQQ